MASPTVPPHDAERIDTLLDSPEVAALIADLQETRWTGRPGYPLRAMVGMAFVKSLYGHATWTRTVRLVHEHDALQRVLGAVPSVYACYRFTAKLVHCASALEACITRVLASLHDAIPDMGTTVAIDGSDLPVYANGQRYLHNHGPERERYSDPDASWGHRSSSSTRKGGGYYGYKPTLLSARPRTCRWRGRSTPRETAKCPWFPCCWTRSPHAGSCRHTRCWTRATTPTRSTTSASGAAFGRSSLCGRPGECSPGNIVRRRASTERGGSVGLTRSAARRSGVAQLVLVRPRRAGSRPTGCIR